MPAAAQKGVSLIELMIGIAVVGILLMIGLPSFGLWMQNTQNRTAAESILNGLQVARMEAVRHNANVRFSLTDASGLSSWTIGCVVVTAECPATIQTRTWADGTANARAGADSTVPPSPLPANYYATALAAAAGLPNGATFDGMGRMPNVNIDISRVDITNVQIAEARRYVVTVSSEGTVRMCDPALSLANNSQGCQ
ncbi:MAG: GspH/FimT family pseudopilin [Sulfuricella sp.]|nr:GspH/FimT family pseudopilin [Sulfuricella sp.]